MNQKIKISIIAGGPSSKHDVSLNSGRGVFDNLDRNYYEPKLLIIAQSGEWLFEREILKDKTDAVFLAIHGEYGEDSAVQSEMEILKIPYTGSGMEASALGMNKFFFRFAFSTSWFGNSLHSFIFKIRMAA